MGNCLLSKIKKTPKSTLNPPSSVKAKTDQERKNDRNLSISQPYTSPESKITKPGSSFNHSDYISKKTSLNQKLFQVSMVNSFMSRPNTLDNYDLIKNELLENAWLLENFDKNTIKQIGSGGFGCVFSAKSLKFGKDLAIKVLKKSPEDQMKQMTNEIWIMISLSDNNNVIKIDEFFADTPKKQVMFSMELGTGSLAQLIKNMQGKIDYSLLLQLIMDCLTGLEYALEKGISHMDIKPENILYFEGVNRQTLKDLQTDIVQNNKIIFKLSDWGGGLIRSDLTRIVSCYSYTFGYGAPEIMNGDFIAFNPSKIDIFAFGMTILNCCGIPVKQFKHLSSFPAAEKFNRELDELLLLIDENYDSIKLIIKKMLAYNPTDRIGLKDLKKQIKIIINGGEIAENKRENKKNEKKKNVPEDFENAEIPNTNELIKPDKTKKREFKNPDQRTSNLEKVENSIITNFLEIKKEDPVKPHKIEQIDQIEIQISNTNSESINKKINLIHDKLQLYYRFLFKKDDLFVIFNENRIMILDKALEGDALAELILGVMYENGVGFPKDIKEARKYFLKATEKNNSDAFVNAGILNFDCEGPDVFIYDENMGIFQFDKEKIENKKKADLKRAFNNFQKASSMKNPRGYYRLGNCYEFGIGCQKNTKKGVKLYKKAAKMDEIGALHFLANCYLTGKECKESKMKAIELYAKLAEKKPETFLFLGLMHIDYNDSDEDLDPELGVLFLTKAAEMNVRHAGRKLANCYRSGVGCPENQSKAFQLYKKEAEKGDNLSQTLLGICYKLGVGCQKDENQAKEIMERPNFEDELSFLNINNELERLDLEPFQIGFEFGDMIKSKIFEKKKLSLSSSDIFEQEGEEEEEEEDEEQEIEAEVEEEEEEGEQDEDEEEKEGEIQYIENKLRELQAQIFAEQKDEDNDENWSDNNKFYQEILKHKEFIKQMKNYRIQNE